MIRYLWLDTETFSTTDITAGAYRYHEASEVLLVQYAFDADPPRVWRVVEGDSIPAELAAALADPDTIIYAHNAQFDRLAMRRVDYDIPAKRWRDTIAQACTIGLPAKLGDLSRRLEMGEDFAKMNDGMRLIKLFCIPSAAGERRWWHEYPDDWEQFVTYGLQDVVAMRRMAYIVGKRHTIRGRERSVWELDQAINARGLPIDRRIAEAGVQLAEHCKYIGNRTIERATDGALATVGQTTKLKAWLIAHGVEPDRVAKCDKGFLGELLGDPELFDLHHAIHTRLTYNRTSPKKYTAMLRHIGPDGRVRGAYRYHKAHTGRWAGEGIQPHNLTRPVGEMSASQLADALAASGGDPHHPEIQRVLDHGYHLPDLLAYAVRGAITAPPGRVIVVADYPQIEARMTHWLAGNTPMVDAFADSDVDPYAVAAAGFLDIPQPARESPERFLGKVTTLGCGYQMGGPKFFATCRLQHGIKDMTLARAVDIVAAWRASNQPVVALWKTLERRLVAKVDGSNLKDLITVPVPYKPERVKPSLPGSNLDVRVELPSGRVLYYSGLRLSTARAEIVFARTQNREAADAREAKVRAFARERGWPEEWWLDHAKSMTYRGEYARHGIYGGLQTENWVQALCRDLLAEAMLETEMMLPPGAELIGHTHDEMIVEADEDVAEDAAAVMSEAMQREVWWTPGLPLGVPDIKIGRRYGK